MAKSIGFLSELQVKVLILKNMGLSYREIASMFGISYGSIASTYKKALKNIKLARETLIFYELLSAKKRIVIKPFTKLVEIPKIVLEEADRVDVKVHADFTLIFKLIRYRARNCILEKIVIKPIVILIHSEGSISVYPYDEITEILEKIEEIENKLVRT